MCHMQNPISIYGALARYRKQINKNKSKIILNDDQETKKKFLFTISQCLRCLFLVASSLSIQWSCISMLTQHIIDLIRLLSPVLMSSLDTWRTWSMQACPSHAKKVSNSLANSCKGS
ncbi:hypothetical protein BpHYR1_026646 [Brachionus plicatilis]|uniref:Uncharacterized protein n=1 Tax=Brachionus plicatilis TaxID=10195 RepID=A0A3M7RME5_BRAPC|nr:hypothetical protein BpHYR1_026646 [Brachionus plicatilis]